MLEKSFASCLVFLGLFAGSAFGAVYTNRWTGAAGNCLFDDAANWESLHDGVSAATILANNCASDRVFYDLGKLADGTCLTNKAKDKFFLTGLIVKGEGDCAWTLASASSNQRFCFRNTSPCLEVSGGTLNLAAMNFINWSGDSNALTIRGGGTVRMCQPASYGPQYYNSDFILEGTKLVIAHASALQFQRVVFKTDDARFELACDTKIVGLHSSASTVTASQVVLNGHTLRLNHGGSNPTEAMTQYYGLVTGPGTIIVQGGIRQKFLSQMPANVAYVAGQGEFQFGSTESPTHPLEPFDFTINMGARAWFRDNVTFATLDGAGVTGSPVLPDGKTITLAGKGDVPVTTHFQSAITGAVNIVKNGAGYDINLSGENGYTGTTAINAGTVTLERPYLRKGLVAYYAFDDPDNLGWDSSEGRCHLPQYVTTQKGSSVTSVADGVFGRAAHFEKDGSEMRLETPVGSSAGVNYTGVPGVSGKFPGGTNPVYTVSVWVRPGNLTTNANVVQFGSAASKSNGAFSIRLNSEKSVCVCTKDVAASCSTGFDFGDGAWHHIAVSQTNGQFNLYIDGSQRWTNKVFTVASAPVHWLGTGRFVIGWGNLWQDSKSYQGDIDELMVFDTVWTPEDVAAEYARKRPCVDPDADAVAALPEPVAHWTFDDSENLGQDSGPYGMHLSVSGTVSAASAAAGPFKGGAIYIDANGLLKQTTPTFPSAFPRGDESFTVFIRAMANACAEQSPVVSWGTASAKHLFELGANSFNRYWSALFESTGNSNTMTSGNETAYGIVANELRWSTITVTYNSAMKTVSFYMNGVLLQTRCTSVLSLDAANLLIGGRCDMPAKLWKGWIDDVRIYNRALTANEVRVIEESFFDGAQGPVLPAASETTLADGATLCVRGAHVLSAPLKGAGTVSLEPGSTLKVENGAAFSGRYVGPGCVLFSNTTAAGDLSEVTGIVAATNATVVLPATTPAFALDLRDGAVVKPTSLDVFPMPVKAASGAVVLDMAAVAQSVHHSVMPVLTFDDDPAEGTTFAVRNGRNAMSLVYDAEAKQLKLTAVVGTLLILK